MTDKQIIKEKGNQKCIFYNDDICRKGDRTRDCLNCARVEYRSLYNLNWNNQDRLFKQLDQLKADRTEALKQLEFVRTLNTVKEAENRKLSKALTEIKEIAEKTLNMVDYKTYFKRDNKSLKQEGFKAIQQILNKISEVLDDN